jgi:hypothetical protein
VLSNINKAPELDNSLTLLNERLASVAVVVYNDCLRNLLARTTSANKVDTFLLRNVVLLGLNTPALRDEIYMQLIYLLGAYTVTSTDTSTSKNRAVIDVIWRCLGCCLSYFPCSKGFENFLELYLLQAGESYMSLVDERPGYRQSPDTCPALECIRLLHEVVFKFGYTATPGTFSQVGGRVIDSSKIVKTMSAHEAVIPLAHILKSYVSGTVYITDVDMWFAQTTLSSLRKAVLPTTDVEIGSTSSSTDTSTVGDGPFGSFRDYGAVDSTGLDEADTQMVHIRGTRDDWYSRFNSLFSSSMKAHLGAVIDTKTYMLSVLDLVNALTNRQSPAYNSMDRVDRELFDFIVFYSGGSEHTHQGTGQPLQPQRAHLAGRQNIHRDFVTDEVVFEYSAEQYDSPPVTYKCIQKQVLEGISSLNGSPTTSIQEFICQLRSAVHRSNKEVLDIPTSNALRSMIRRCILWFLVSDHSRQLAADREMAIRVRDPRAAIQRFWSHVVDELFALLEHVSTGSHIDADNKKPPDVERDTVPNVSFLKQAFSPDCVCLRTRPSADIHAPSASVSLTHISWEVYHELLLVCAEFYLKQ